VSTATSNKDMTQNEGLYLPMPCEWYLQETDKTRWCNAMHRAFKDET